MLSAIRRYLGQRTTIQGFAVLATVVALFKLHVITGEAAGGFAMGGLTLIGLPETPLAVTAPQPIPVTAPERTDPGAAPIPVQVIGEHT